MKIALILIAFSSTCFAQTPAEQAVILNQELQFLEESARTPTTPRQIDAPTTLSRGLPQTDESLERTYFSDDEVRTRTAAPRRRAVED
jgi:hypothetical protein